MKNFTRRDVIKAGLGLTAAPLVATPFLTYGASKQIEVKRNAEQFFRRRRKIFIGH